MMPSGAETVAVTDDDGGRETDGWIRIVWRAGAFLTVLTGILHLVNVSSWGRVTAGPLVMTPFRLVFTCSWLLLILMVLVERRLPRPGAPELLVGALAVIYLARAALEPDTFGIAFNWLATAAGVYFLLRLGIRDKKDVLAILYGIVTAVLVIAFFGVAEYLAKENPLFDAIEVEAIGIDRRIAASDQFYRIRSLVGHPGFAAAILLAGIPLLMQVFWRRRLLMAVSVLAAGAALFATFSRGSWLIGLVLLLPLLLYRSRLWFRRNLKWAVPLVLVLLLLMAVDNWRQEKVFVHFEKPMLQEGLVWSMGDDGPVIPVSGGIMPLGRFVYLEADPGFAGEEPGLVTAVIYYRDDGRGAVRVEYYSRDRSGADAVTGLTLTPSIHKTDTGEISTAAFQLKEPDFNGLLNRGADFRVVDDDNRIVLQRVELHAGRLKLPEIIKQQWLSRSSSISTRAELFPFAWDVFRDAPWGVGLFNSPGTGNHAIDSWPLTWLMEFGWLSFPLLLLLVGVIAREVVKAVTGSRCPATVILLSMLLLLAHGGHLMILYDKPSIVMLSALTAAYAAVRPWRKNGAIVEIDSDDCAL